MLTILGANFFTANIFGIKKWLLPKMPDFTMSVLALPYYEKVFNFSGFLLVFEPQDILCNMTIKKVCQKHEEVKWEKPYICFCKVLITYAPLFFLS